MEEYELIKTSDSKWLEKAIKHYSSKVPFRFMDDAKIGISEQDLRSAVSLMRKFKEKTPSSRQLIIQMLTGIGVTSTGMWLVWLAIIDPEPTSKLTALTVGGVTLMLTGGLSTLWALGHKWKVTIRKGKTIITVEPKD